MNQLDTIILFTTLCSMITYIILFILFTKKLHTFGDKLDSLEILHKRNEEKIDELYQYSRKNENKIEGIVKGIEIQCDEIDHMKDTVSSMSMNVRKIDIQITRIGEILDEIGHHHP